jgi:glycine/D-amino acid oxidase-like deaminating enzyme
MTTSHKTHRADYAVVGSGVAGLRTAIELSESGSVLVLAKSDLSPPPPGPRVASP